MAKMTNWKNIKYVKTWALLAVILTVAGCAAAYRIEYPNVSEIPPSSAMVIDGDWRFDSIYTMGTTAKRRTVYSILRIEKGRVYSIDMSTIVNKGGIVGKSIRQIKSSEYELYWIDWDRRKRETHFNRATIKIIDPSHIILTQNIDTKPRRYQLTSIQLDNELAYLQEWEKMNGGSLKEAEILNTYLQYLKKYPNSQYSAPVQARITTLVGKIWKKTQELDTAYAYQDYLHLYPDSEFSNKARERLDWKKTNLKTTNRLVLSEFHSEWLLTAMETKSKVTIEAERGSDSVVKVGGTIEMDASVKSMVWNPGAEHTLIGTVRLAPKPIDKPFIFESDLINPLVFQVDRYSGYIYKGGLGIVTYPDGEMIRLENR